MFCFRNLMHALSFTLDTKTAAALKQRSKLAHAVAKCRKVARWAAMQNMTTGIVAPKAVATELILLRSRTISYQ
jgi:hypothetical protein